MARFDVADAALAGFGVIRSKPLAVLVWAVVLYVLAVLPAIGLLSAVISLARELPSLAESSGDAPDVLHRMVGLQAGLLMGHPFASIGSLLVRVLLAAAVIRAVATPKDDRFFYLRFGRGELMLVLVTIVAAILMIAVMFASILAIVALTLAANSVSDSLTVAVAIIGGLLLFIGIVWLLLRFSLIAPASVVEKEFRLFESWRLTKGHAFSLLLVAILNFIVAILVQAVLSALVFGIGGIALVAFGGLHFDAGTFERFLDTPPEVLMQQLLPWFLGAGLVGAIIGAVFFTLAIAPWAYVYKALTEPVEAHFR